MAERRLCPCRLEPHDQAEHQPLSEAELFAAYGAKWEAEVTRIRRMLATRTDLPRTASAIAKAQARVVRR